MDAGDIPLLSDLLHMLLLWSVLYNISDNAITSLLKSLKGIFKEMQQQSFTPDSFGKFSEAFPTSTTAIYNLCTKGQCTPHRKEMVVCQKCYSIYDFDCKNPPYYFCIHQKTPGHSHASRRLACGHPLFSLDRSAHRPLSTYNYIPISDSLECILSRPGIVDQCYAWQKRTNSDPDLICDIYDGRVWKEFTEHYPSSLAEGTLSLGLTLNVDWFQPFKHTCYSIGVLFFSILNLPRDILFKEENIVLLGVIPGPKEPPLNINSFLRPFTSELQNLFDGIRLSVVVHGIQLQIQALLILIVSDIPATRRILALPGHSATLGCSKCLKKFTVVNFGEKPDYSGFDCDNWVKRDFTQHRKLALEYQKLPNPSSQKAFELKHGLRFCQLLELPYFDIIRFHVIDPMHNLFEGSAKTFMRLLLDKKLLDSEIVRERMKTIVTPGKVGRLPMKIEANYSGFTADQWRNWCIIYSPIVLKDAIPPRVYTIWIFFVQACKSLCRRAIRRTAIIEADEKLRQFCEGVEDFFGKDACTPNMHLHLHLKECALDYGPLYSYWCFPFERYNGTLSGYSTNKKDIEKQIVKKFFRSQLIRSLPTPPCCNHLTPSIQDTHIGDNSIILSTSEFLWLETLQSISKCKCIDFAFPGDKLHSKLANMKTTTTSLLRLDEQKGLSMMYHNLYGNSISIKNVSAYVETATVIMYAGETIRKGQLISARWPLDSQAPCIRIGEVRNIVCHHIIIDGPTGVKEIDHLIVEAWWYKHHSQFNYYGPPCIIIDSIYDPAMSMHQYIPIQRVSGHCAYARLRLSLPKCPANEEVIVVNPLPFNFTIV